MLVEDHRPAAARPSGRQLALPLIPLAIPPPATPVRPDVARPERVWPDLPPTTRALVRRAFVAVVQEMLDDGAGE